MSSIIAFMLYDQSDGNAPIVDPGIQRRFGMAALGEKFAAEFLGLGEDASDNYAEAAVKDVISQMLTEDFLPLGALVREKRYKLVYSSEGFGGAGDEYPLSLVDNDFLFNAGGIIRTLVLVARLDKPKKSDVATANIVRMNIALSRRTGANLLSPNNYLAEVVADIRDANTSDALAARYTLGSITFRRCK